MKSNDTNPFFASRMERREFLRTLGLTGAGILLGSPLARVLASEYPPAKPGQVPVRKFGRHDLMLPTLGLGGHALGRASDDEAAAMIDAAIELGATFLDNAWDYHGGRSEELMGKLIDGRRDRFFLMTKVCTHDAADDYAMAMRMLDESLKRLRTDHLDLWQWHAVSSLDQVKKGFESKGVVDALFDAKKQGKVRFVGFTGHTHPDVSLAVLKEKAPFDASQIPISPIEANSDAFVRRVLPELIKQEIAPLAMKTLGGNFAPVKDHIFSLNEGLQYAWSHPITTVISGVTTVDQLRQNAALAAAFQPMAPDQMLALEDRVVPATDSNRFQPYRNWMSYRDGDSTQMIA